VVSWRYWDHLTDFYANNPSAHALPAYKTANFCRYFNHFYTFFTPGPAIFSSSFYCPPYTQAIKNNTSGGVP